MDGIAEAGIEHENTIVGLFAQDILSHGIKLIGAVLRDENEAHACHLFGSKTGMKCGIFFFTFDLFVFTVDSFDEHGAEKFVFFSECKESVKVTFVRGLFIVSGGRLGLFRRRGCTVGSGGRGSGSVFGHGEDR